MKTVTILFIASLFLVTQAFAFNGDNKPCWDANTESDLAGYNIYLSTVSGDYIDANGNLSTNAIKRDVGLTADSANPCDFAFNNYLDAAGNPLTDGQYFMVVTAYDTSANESLNSNEVSVPLDFTPPVDPANARIE